MVACKAIPIDGRATLTTVVSSTITKNPTEAATRTRHDE